MISDFEFWIADFKGIIGVLIFSLKTPNTVTPAKAGVQNSLTPLDSRLRGNDNRGRYSTLYEFIRLKMTRRIMLWSVGNV